MRIDSIRARAVDVPLNRPLQTAGGLVRTAPLVLIDLGTDEGITGCGYVFCYTPVALAPLVSLITSIGDWLRGDECAPLAIERKLQSRFRLLGPQGLTGIAMAGLDMAAWDARSKAAGVPLVVLLGGSTATTIPAYNSCGLGLIGEQRVEQEALELAEGFTAIKARLGYPDLETDIAVVAAAARAGCRLMTDYNQSLTVPEAVRRCRALDSYGLLWVEEPLRADDYTGHAQVTREAATPIQLGENCWGAHDLAKAADAHASDLVMADVMKIGGVSGWLRAASMAELRGLPLSSHLFPEISVHLLAISPTAHWLEYVDFAAPVLEQPLEIADGVARPPDRPGAGIAWDEAAVQQYLL